MTKTMHTTKAVKTLKVPLGMTTSTLDLKPNSDDTRRGSSPDSLNFDFASDQQIANQSSAVQHDDNNDSHQEKSRDKSPNEKESQLNDEDRKKPCDFSSLTVNSNSSRLLERDQNINKLFNASSLHSTVFTDFSQKNNRHRNSMHELRSTDNNNENNSNNNKREKLLNFLPLQNDNHSLITSSTIPTENNLKHSERDESYENTTACSPRTMKHNDHTNKNSDVRRRNLNYKTKTVSGSTGDLCNPKVDVLDDEVFVVRRSQSMDPRETRHGNKHANKNNLHKEIFRRKFMHPNTTSNSLSCSPLNTNSIPSVKPHTPPFPPEYLETRRKTFAHIEKSQHHQHATCRISYEKWMELKSHERRRKSLSAAHFEELGKFCEEKSRQSRFEHAQPFDKWKELKDKEIKDKQLKEKEHLRESKCKQDEEEKIKNQLKEKKYNAWLQKKFEEEIAVEQLKIERLRMTSSPSRKANPNYKINIK